MCGRFTLQSPSDTIAELFDGLEVDGLSPRYNVAPTQRVPALRTLDGETDLALFRWGLIPFFAKDPSIGARMINARSETVAEKPSFRAAFKRRRCLVPADGFLEWERVGKERNPYHFTLADGEPFAMAGLWERWRSPDDEVIESCTILTTEANDLVGAIHDRMPVILPREDHALWIDSSVEDRDLLLSLLRPYEASAMRSRAVSRRVNNARHDDEDCLADA